MINAMTEAIGSTLNGEPYKPLEEERLNQYWLDLSVSIPEPEPLIRQGDVTMCTRGNFSCVTGQAKSRKTFLISAMVGAFLCPDEYLGMNGTTDTGVVLYIDTEQAIPHVHRIIRRIHRIAGLPTDKNSDRLKVLCLRELSPSERKKIVEIAMRKVKPILCVIDGVADLMEDTNSNLESVSIASLLLKLTTQYDCHIITALHTNPNSDRARGHIGSEITRKAETVVNITKDGDTSVVRAAYCRDMDIQDFAFFINSTGLPELTKINDVQPAKAQKLKDLFTKILPLPNTMTYSDLVNRVMEEVKIKERMAKRKIEEALSAGVLEKNNAEYYHLKQKEIESNGLPF